MSARRTLLRISEIRNVPSFTSPPHLSATLTIVAVAAAIAASSPRTRAAAIGDVFVIALENHNFTQPTTYTTIKPIFGNVAAPFINSLITPGNANAANVSYATNYTNAGVGVHPSEPNYIWSEAATNYNPATNFTVTSDNDPTSTNKNIFSIPHLTGLMNAAAISWKNYQEDYQVSSKGATISASGTLPGGATNPYNGSTAYSYAAKHDPMAFFSDTATQNLAPISALAADLASNTVGRYNWITPNLYNDMHSALSGGFNYHGTPFTGDQAAVAQGDNFLSILIPQIEASAAFRNNGMIVIWNDETEGGDTTATTSTEIVISPLAKGNAYSSAVPLNHSSDIKTMQEIFGLGSSYLANAIPASEYSPARGSGNYNTVSASNDFTDLLKPATLFPFVQPATWIAGRVGNWSAPANWQNAVIPGNAGSLSYAVTINGGTATLNIDATISSLTLSSGTLTGAANLTLASATINGSYNLTGTTTLAADPITNTPVGTLIFNGGLHNAGAFTGDGNILINPSATLTADAITLNQLTINGSLLLRSNAPTASRINALSLAGNNGNWTASFDVTNNKLIIQSADPATKLAYLATLRDQVQSYGHAGSLGITSSTLPANFALAVIDNAFTGFTSFGNQSVDSNSVLLSEELLGDTNADGHVDLSDLSTLLNNFGAATLAWTAGNFHGQPTIDLTDLSDVLNNFGLTYANSSNAPVSPAIPTPEPASLALLASAALFLPKRKHRLSRRMEPFNSQQETGN